MTDKKKNIWKQLNDELVEAFTVRGPGYVKEDGEQPCNNPRFSYGLTGCTYPHQCPICHGWRGFCHNCNQDHHQNGWQNCNESMIKENDRLNNL